MIELRWSLRSRIDIDDLLDFYHPIDPDLADRIEAAVREAPSLLLDHPLAGPRVGSGDLRKWPVRGLPLLLPYRPTSAAIEIDRVVDTRSDWLPT